MISFKGRHHQQDIILQCVRWYVAYSLSYRDLEELMQERGYAVDHSTVQRWVVHYAPRIEEAFRKNKKRAGNRWRLDETYVKIKGEWRYLYRAVDKQGNTAGTTHAGLQIVLCGARHVGRNRVLANAEEMSK